MNTNNLIDKPISMKAVLEILEKNWLNGTVAHRIIDELSEQIKELPPVDIKEYNTNGK